MKGLVILRSLRPIRLVSRSEDLRELVTQLIRSTRPVVNVFFFMLIVEDGDNWMAAFDPLLMDKVPLLPPGHVDQIHSPPLYRHYYIHYQRSHPRIPYPSHG